MIQSNHPHRLYKLVEKADKMTALENILSYMINFLEKPHPVFSNMPPCPYARKERLANQIFFFEAEIAPEGATSSLLEEIRKFDANPKWTTMLIYSPKQLVDIVACYNFAQKITDALADIHVLAIPLHPDDTFAVQNVRTREVPYPIILLQRRSVLTEAKEKLLNTKYYANWTDRDYRVMSTIHQKLHNEGIFFPFLWWTDEVLNSVKQGAPFPEAVISSTVNLLTQNDTHFWMYKWGKSYGWRPFCGFKTWRKIRDLAPSSIILATAHGGSNDGLTALLHPQEDLDSDIPSAYPSLKTWATSWSGGSYIWIYDEEILEKAS